MNDSLTALITQWRERAKGNCDCGFETGWTDGKIERCADELDAVLTRLAPVPQGWQPEIGRSAWADDENGRNVCGDCWAKWEKRQAVDAVAAPGEEHGNRPIAQEREQL